MNRVIILEGPDGGGKTTLANRLRDQYNYQVWHTGKPEPWFEGDDLFEHYDKGLQRASYTACVPVVFDRQWLGELVYGPIMRHHCHLTEEHVKCLENKMRIYEIKLCIVLPPFEEVQANWGQKNVDYLPTMEKLKAVYKAYEKLAARYWTYDYTTDDKDNTRFIREALC